MKKLLLKTATFRRLESNARYGFFPSYSYELMPVGDKVAIEVSNLVMELLMQRCKQFNLTVDEFLNIAMDEVDRLEGTTIDHNHNLLH